MKPLSIIITSLTCIAFVLCLWEGLAKDSIWLIAMAIALLIAGVWFVFKRLPEVRDV